jgi:hypothetical protein
MPFGDAGLTRAITGRNNMVMSVINDRFPDPHFMWMMNNDTGDLWGDGLDGTGGIWKLIFYPYVNAPSLCSGAASTCLADLPLSRQFGPDVSIRTGWSTSDTMLWFTGSIPGSTHRQWNAGDFGIYRGNYLIGPSNYSSSGDPAYQQYHRKSIGNNVPQSFDPANCWTEDGNCGQEYDGLTASGEGGQRDTLREFNPPFVSAFNQSRLWSATSITPAACTGGSWYCAVTPIPAVKFNLWSGVGEHAGVDLTNSYTNVYGSGTNSAANPTANLTPTTAGSVTRDLVHFQPTSGDTYPDRTVIFDRVTSASSTFQKSNVIHTVGAIQAHSSGSWSNLSAGITSATAYDAMRADNGTSRVYMQPLLPAGAETRAVGGHTFSPIAITGATLATNAVFTTANAHGLTPGEYIALSLGTGNNATPGWGVIDVFSAFYNQGTTYTVATTPSPTTFTLSPPLNSTTFTSWATVFGNSGSSAPVGACTSGYMYYQTGATPVPWYCTGTWNQGQLQEPFASPVIAYHQIGGYEAWVDQWGAASSPGSNLTSNAEVTREILVVPPVASPTWRAEIQPPTSEATDYFLTVITPTSTSLASAPTSTLITATGWYGAQVTDTGASYVAMFPTNGATPQTSASYTLSASGTVKHMVTGLADGTYVVTQGSTGIGSVTAAADGSVSFNSTGGGNFTINVGAPASGGAFSISAATAISPGAIKH